MGRRRQLLAAAGVLLGVAALVGTAWALRDDGDSPAATSTPFATSTAAPASATAIPFESLVHPAPSTWETGTFAPGGPIDWQQGVFFMDTATGEVHGVRVSVSKVTRTPTPAPGGAAEPPSVNFYQVAGGGRWILAFVAPPLSGVLYERPTGNSWTWDDAQLRLRAVSTNYFLFERVTGPSQPIDGTGEYIIADATLKPVAQFSLGKSWWAPAPLISDDGQAAVWTVEKGESGHAYQYRLHIAGVTNPVPREVFVTSLESVGKEDTVAGYAKAEATGAGFIVRKVTRDPFAYPAALYPEPSEEVAFDWQGRQLSRRAAPGGLLSPDGRYLVYEVSLRYDGGGGSEGGGDRWQALVVARADGTELFRVRSASFLYGDGIPEQRWLADSSGFVALIKRDDEGAPGWPQVQYAVIHTDGTIQPLPPLPPVPAPRRWFESDFIRGPVPHPTDPALLSFGHFQLLDLRTGTWRSVRATNDDGPGHIDPWAAGPREMVFGLPHGGHGGLGLPVLLAPKVDRPPFPDGMAMIVASGGCLNLREEPDISSKVMTCLAPGTPLQLSPVTIFSSEATAKFTESGTWLHVAQGGWVNAAFVEWAGP
jgi:hypothetical protein